MLIRKAKPKDSDTLCNLAYKSKSYWGYSIDFLKRCKDDLTVTVEYIEQDPVMYWKRIVRLLPFIVSI